MQRDDAIRTLDTGDIYYPPEHRIDGIPGWLAQTMTDTGLRGSFYVMGEKAEELRLSDWEEAAESSKDA